MRADVPPYAARQWVVVGCASSPFFALAMSAAADEQNGLLVIAIIMAFLIVGASAVLYVIEQRIKLQSTRLHGHDANNTNSKSVDQG